MNRSENSAGQAAVMKRWRIRSACTYKKRMELWQRNVENQDIKSSGEDVERIELKLRRIGGVLHHLSVSTSDCERRTRAMGSFHTMC